MKWVRLKDKLPPVDKVVHLKIESVSVSGSLIGKHDDKILSCINERAVIYQYELWWAKEMDSWWLDENPDNREVYKCGPECKSGVRLRLVLGEYDQLKFDYDKIEKENKQLCEMLNSIDNTIKPWKSLLKSTPTKR